MTCALYEPHPAKVRAVQFRGSLSSALGCWTLCKARDVVLTIPQKNSVLILHPGKVTERIIRSSDWIVAHQGGWFEGVTDHDFNARYQPAGGE